jgi:hypothetical protein
LLIHPAVRNCVAFLGRKHGGEDRIVATAFFLSLKMDRFYFPYLITAAHIIEHTKSLDYSDDGIIYLHLNTNTGTRIKPIHTEIEKWYIHPIDKAMDVAVLPFEPLPELGHSIHPLFESPEFEIEPQRWRIDIGTDVFIPGLFLRHRGRQRNIPILRTGTIAALPDKMEPVDIGDESTGEERNIRAYLIETHSLGGLSGSPVFANPIDIVSKGPQLALQALHIWIGVVSAHWDFDQDRTEQGKINSGIAIVSPKESVLEVLQHPRLIEMREQEVKRRKRGSAPTMDDAGEPMIQKTPASKKGESN